jgi:hypothetical protein
MIAVQFPPPQFRIKKKGEVRHIFDVIRKRWLVLTEEEWVRQNMIAYLIVTLSYPKEVIAVEKVLNLNSLKKRFDVLVYDKQHRPYLMVECKAPDVPLNEDVLQQVLRYNIALPVTWIVLTNGRSTIAWKKVGEQLLLADAIPVWEKV